MKLYAIICTRDKDLNPNTSTLVNTLSSYGVDVKLLVNQSSIFSAYKKGMEVCNASSEDIIICCHDDIVLLDGKVDFIAALSKCADPKNRDCRGQQGPLSWVKMQYGGIKKDGKQVIIGELLNTTTRTKIKSIQRTTDLVDKP